MSIIEFLRQTKIAFLKHELVHLILTLIIAGAFWLNFHDWHLLIACFLVGFLIDIDHLFDYFHFFGLKFKLKEFLNVESYIKPAAKVYVVLHGWEYIVLFWLIGRWIGVPGLEWAMSFSYLSHLLWDNFSFKHHPLAYSFINRLINNFNLEAFNARGF